jgi:hypothetical protein
MFSCNSKVWAIFFSYKLFCNIGNLVESQTPLEHNTLSTTDIDVKTGVALI